jgi:hypothetical protein
MKDLVEKDHPFNEAGTFKVNSGAPEVSLGSTYSIH